MPVNFIENAPLTKMNSPEVGEVVANAPLEGAFTMDLQETTPASEISLENLPEQDALHEGFQLTVWSESPPKKLMIPRSIDQEAPLALPTDRRAATAPMPLDATNIQSNALSTNLVEDADTISPADIPLSQSQKPVAIQGFHANSEHSLAGEKRSQSLPISAPLPSKSSNFLAMPKLPTSINNPEPASGRVKLANTVINQVDLKHIETSTASTPEAASANPADPLKVNQISIDLELNSQRLLQELSTLPRTLNKSVPDMPSLQRIAIAPQILAKQISSAISNISQDKIELRLDPPELGRVIITISQTESGMTAHVSAEKTDIAEFLRRNAEILERELTKSGLEGFSLEFSQHDENTSERKQDTNGFASSAETTSLDADSSIERTVNYISHNGLDIRI